MPRLPEFIFDSYKRYKADTNQLTAWLVETAKGLGYGLELPLSTKGELPRKHALDAAALGTATASSVAEYRRIFVNDFIKLASFIAGTHHRIKVPILVLKLARSAIAIRKHCAEWFRNQTAQEEDTSDKAHWHFIIVLEEVVQILDPLCDTKPTSVETNAGDAAPLLNPFLHLEVEEANDEDVFEILPPLVVDHNTSPPHQLVVYTVADDDDDDSLVAIYCIFKDLGDIQTFLRETWSDYRDKKIDLITASVTTNMAFEIIRSMLEDLLVLNPEFNNYETIACILCSAAYKRLGIDPSAMQLVDMLNSKMVIVEEFVYLPAYMLLRSFHENIPGPGMVLAKLPGHFGIYDPHRCRNLLSRKEKKLEDKIILFETLPHFVLIGSLGSLRRQQAVPDELTKEMEKMMCNKEVSLLLVFAIQVYLDIHHVLREQVSRGFEDLRSAAVHANISLRLRSQNSPREEFTNWPIENETSVRSLESFIQKWILQDYLGSMLPSIETDSYYLLARHPFLCGMMQFRLQLEFQGTGLALATSWGTILCLSHLYEAGKHAGFWALGRIWNGS